MFFPEMERVNHYKITSLRHILKQSTAQIGTMAL